MSPSAKNLTFLTKTSLSLKICTRWSCMLFHIDVLHSHYIFICWLFNKSLLINSCCQYSRTYMCDHLPYATTCIRQNNPHFPSHIPIIGTSCKRPPPKSDCEHFLAWKLYWFQYCFQHLVGTHCTWRMVSSTLMKVLHSVTVCEGLLVRTRNYGTYCNSKLFGEETHCGSLLLIDHLL